jgi:hypothetical protein
MIPSVSVPFPLLFNPLKHHLGYIRHFIEEVATDNKMAGRNELVRELKHIGGSVMDVYSGELSYMDICDELLSYLNDKRITETDRFISWAGEDPNDFRTIHLSDGSQWILKYYENELRYIHSFPARFSPHSFRIKANTLRSAILYQIFIGKDFITEENLNTARAIGGLSPVKDVMDTEAVTEMIEMLRG